MILLEALWQNMFLLSIRVPQVQERLYLIKKAIGSILLPQIKTEVCIISENLVFAEDLAHQIERYAASFVVHINDVHDKSIVFVDEDEKKLKQLYEEGKVKAIGLSNFLPHHIESLMETAKVKPMVDQIEFHPGYTQEMTVSYCQERNIIVQAWSPLGRTRMFENVLLKELAEKESSSVSEKLKELHKNAKLF